MELVVFLYISEISSALIFGILVVAKVIVPQWRFYSDQTMNITKHADTQLFQRLLCDDEGSTAEMATHDEDLAEEYWSRSNRGYIAFLIAACLASSLLRASLLLVDSGFWYRHAAALLTQTLFLYSGTLFMLSANPLMLSQSSWRILYRRDVSAPLSGRLALVETMFALSSAGLFMEPVKSFPLHSIIAVAAQLLAIMATVKFYWKESALLMWEQDFWGKDPINRERDASLWSRLTFAWLEDLIESGHRRSKNIGTPLTTESLWKLMECDTSDYICRKWFALPKEDSMLVRLFLLVRSIIARQTLYALASCLLYFSGPYFLNRILVEIDVESDGGSITWALLYVLGMFLSSVIRAVCDGQTFYLGRKMGIAVRASLIGSLYSTSLSRSAFSRTPSGGKALETDFSGSQGSSYAIERRREATGQSIESSTSLLAAEVAIHTLDVAEEFQKVKESSAPLTSGEVVNLMAVDTQKLSDSFCYIHYYWVCPFQILIAISLLLRVFSWPALGGVAVMLLILPINGFLGSKVQAAQSAFLKSVDGRMRTVSEVLQGIKVIKFLAWEPKLEQLITGLRYKELASLKQYLFSVYTTKILSLATPILASGVSFYTYTKLAGWELNAATAFTALALFNSLRVPLSILPEFYLRAMESTISFRRMQLFFHEKKVVKANYRAGEDSNNLSICGIFSYGDEGKGTQSPVSDKPHDTPSFKKAIAKEAVINNGELNSLARSVSLKSELAQATGFSLKITSPLQFPIKKLSLIVGPTGCGKSSLLLALLHEIEAVKVTGDLYVDEVFNPSLENTCFVPQTAWLQNATVRDNIVFGGEWDPLWYQKVVDACALAQDFKILNAGDLTEVGEKGTNLSGGQRQRVCLARAVYCNRPVVLLDDCLSAVDAATAKHLFNECIVKLLVEQQNRTVILVTHAIQLCAKAAASITLMEADGSIVARGTFLELKHLDHFSQASNSSGYALVGKQIRSRQTSSEAANSQVSTEGVVGSSVRSPNSFVVNDHNLKRGSLTNEEERRSGSVSLAIYKRYVTAAGGVQFVILFVSAFLTAQALNMAQDFWVMKWSLAFKNMVAHDRYLWIYLGIGALIIFAYLLRLSTQVYGSLSASKELHNLVLKRLLRAPIRFFDVNPLGRILNRLGKDMQAVDQEVMPWFGELAHFSLALAGIVLVILYSTPVVLIGLVPITAVAVSTARRYLATTRELKRLDSISRSPIYSFFSETLSGILTIRAYHAEKRFLARENNLVDVNHQCYLYQWACNRWLGLRVDLIGAFVGLLSSLAVVLAVNFPELPILGGRMNSGLAGVSLSFTLMCTESLLWVVRMHALLEMSLNSVERLDEYLNVDQESQIGAKPLNWPTKGAIEINDLRLRYDKSLPFVLNGLSCSIPGGTKVGIVGRTGAGKSSLVQALFRLTEPDSGKILIDGVDIESLDLHFLRSKVTIIPQDPVLFSGTVRSNLNMFGEIEDDQRMQDALAQVGLGALSLDHAIHEFGAGFSQGQKQLLCLVRAFLRKSHVVILDEPTSSVDHETDSLTQRAVRQHCKDSTVLCIAHRLRSIADFDMVLVLDHGVIVEQGTPYELMVAGKLHSAYDSKKAKTGGFNFWSMCIESGEPDVLFELSKASS